MTISFRCPKCQKQVGASDAHAGRRVKCPDCGTVIVVPTPGAKKKAPAPAAEQPQRTALAPSTAEQQQRQGRRWVIGLVCIGVVSAVLTGTLIGLWLTNPGQAMDPTHRAVTRYLLENEIGDPDFEYVKWEEEPFGSYRYGVHHMAGVDFDQLDQYKRVTVTVRVTMLGGKVLQTFRFLTRSGRLTHMRMPYYGGFKWIPVDVNKGDALQADHQETQQAWGNFFSDIADER